MRSIKRWQRLATLAALARITFTTPTHAGPWDGTRDEFVSPRFEQVWRDADLPVQQGTIERSWTWGPKPWYDYQEAYQQGFNGMRQVQYFDKARMEINDPENTSGPLGGVTNGLLTVEMVSGRIKYGDGTGPDQNQQRTAAEIQVAGNIGLDAELVTPTYATFAPFATTDNGYRDTNKIGQRAGTMLTATGNTSFRSNFAAHSGTEYVVYEGVTGHNIPRVFENFRNSGPISSIAAFGYPITDPYWVQARVGTDIKDVMVQLYERRTLTYTPTNPAAFQVEMGNVGQHYFQWRYNQGTPWVTPDPEIPVVFASKRNGNVFNIFTQPSSGTDVTVFYNAPDVQMIPSSIRRSWSESIGVFGNFVNAQNKRVLMSVTAYSRQPAVLSDQSVNTYEPAISPDGQSMLFVSDKDGNPEIYLSSSNTLASHGKQLTNTSNCENAHPSWFPDGTGFVYESTCDDGNWNIFAGYLSYRVIVNPDLGTIPEGILRGSTRLTSNPTQDRMPRMSPDGTRVAFVSDRDGDTNIYTINLDGSGQSSLTTTPGRDEGPAWSPDGQRIAFNSNRDGDFEIFIMNSNGSGVRPLTSTTVDEGYAVWGY